MDRQALNARDRKLLELLSAVKRGDGYVMRGVGMILLAIMGWTGWSFWEGLSKQGPDWGLFVFVIFVGFFGALLLFGAKRRKKASGVFQNMLQGGEKIVVQGMLQEVGLNAHGGLTYRIDGRAYPVSIPFLQPYVFIPALDNAQIFQANKPITLHVLEQAPGKYLRLHVDYGDRVEKQQVVDNYAFIPQHMRHSIFATALVSVIVAAVWVMLEVLMRSTAGAWFSNPEISGMGLAFTLVPALIALSTFLIAKRRYKVLTVVRGRLSEVLEAHARSGKIRLPHQWYTVGGEVLQVAPSSAPLVAGAMVEAKYVEGPKDHFPLPVSIEPIAD